VLIYVYTNESIKIRIKNNQLYTYNVLFVKHLKKLLCTQVFLCFRTCFQMVVWLKKCRI